MSSRVSIVYRAKLLDSYVRTTILENFLLNGMGFASCLPNGATEPKMLEHPRFSTRAGSSRSAPVGVGVGPACYSMFANKEFLCAQQRLLREERHQTAVGNSFSVNLSLVKDNNRSGRFIDETSSKYSFRLAFVKVT